MDLLGNKIELNNEARKLVDSFAAQGKTPLIFAQSGAVYFEK